LADIYKEVGDYENYEKAFNEYRLIPNKTQAKECLQLMIDNSQDDYQPYVQQGEYLLSIFETQDAIKSFNKATDVEFATDEPRKDVLKSINGLI
jgi:hypothetical protein